MAKINPISRLRFGHRIASRVRRDLAAAGSAVAPPRVSLTNPTPYLYDFTLQLDRGEMVIMPSEARHHTTVHISRYRMAPFVHMFGQCTELSGAFICDASDGCEPGLARFASSSADPDKTLLPDSYFFNARGFATAAEASKRDGLAWNLRSETITWRGTCTGAGIHPCANSRPDDRSVNMRSRVCLALRGVSGTDAGITGSDRPNWPANLFRQLGIWAERRDEPEWLGDKFALDIDGWTNTWSNFIVRLHYGCCVLKVDSQFGFRQWYYDRLRPWEHFIPIKADLSDLVEKIDWARANDVRCREIAAHGQALARSMTMDSEMAWGASAIRATTAA